MKVSPRMVEELLCLLSKDPEKQQKRCEPSIIDQVYCVCLEDPKGNYCLSQISQAQPKWTNCIVPVWCDTTPTTCDTAELPWWTVAWRLDNMLACPVKGNIPFRVVDVLLLDKMLDEHPSAQQIVHVALCQRNSLLSSNQSTSTSVVGVKGGQQPYHGTTDSPATAELPHTMTSVTPPLSTTQRLARVNAIMMQAKAVKEMVLVDELLDSLEAEKEQFNAIYYDWLATQQAGSVAEACDGSIIAQSDLQPVVVLDVGISDTNASGSDEDYFNSDETAWELSCSGEAMLIDNCNMD
jgi:hypothetical protein